MAVATKSSSSVAMPLPEWLNPLTNDSRYEEIDFVNEFWPMFRSRPVKDLLGYKGSHFAANDFHQRFFYAENSLKGSVLFTSKCEGPPSCAHGGSVATALDEAFANLTWRKYGFAIGAKVLLPTTELRLFYKKFTPLETPLLIEVIVVGEDDRNLHLKGQIRKMIQTINLDPSRLTGDGDSDPRYGEVCIEASASFYIRPAKQRMKNDQIVSSSSSSPVMVSYATAKATFGKSSGTTPEEFAVMIKEMKSRSNQTRHHSSVTIRSKL